MSWKPIIVGVDASPQAVDAATFASRLAARAGATCRLIHATSDALVAPEVPESAHYREALAQHARALVITTLADALPPQLLDTLTVRLGPTPGVLKQSVAELGAELIVLGGKHHSALGRWIGGSTSLDVARTTEVPLLVTAGPTAIRRVLAAVDISGAARPPRPPPRAASPAPGAPRGRPPPDDRGSGALRHDARSRAPSGQRARAAPGHPERDASVRRERVLRSVGGAAATWSLVAGADPRGGQGRAL